jgi:hypothetical protein
LLPPEQVPRPVQATRVGRGGKAPDQAGNPWGQAEDAQLAAAFDAGQSIRDLAPTHRRTEGAIHSRLLRLGRLTLVPNARDGSDPALPVEGIGQAARQPGPRRPAAQPARPVPEWKRIRPRGGKPWTPDEDGALLQEFDAGLSLEEIARRTGRGVFAVEVRLSKLGRDVTARSGVKA